MTNLDAQTSAARRFAVADDLAYILPMAVFLLFVAVGGWWPALFPASYIARAGAAGVLLILFRRQYTRIDWNYWWLGLILGVAGLYQWVYMQLWLERHFAYFAPMPADELYNPFARIHSPALAWVFIAIRLAGAAIVVPFMEELFWRDYLWRQIIAPNDFKLARVGEWDWKAFVAVPLAFAAVHGNWWPTAIVWGLMIGGLLAVTRSLGACIVMHATTNLLLGIYVLRYQAWAFW